MPRKDLELFGDLLQILIGEFEDKLHSLQGLIPRMAQFPEASGKIKVAIGMRRTGKTYFLYQTILSLIKSGVPKESILYINFEDDRLYPLTQGKLGGLIDAFYTIRPENHNRKCYLFLDEIQNVEDWPTVIRRVHDSKNVEIFLTGSSAKLLSREIATNLRGRSLATEIWPYSFEEYLTATGLKINKGLYDNRTLDLLNKQLANYMSDGGFPELTGYTMGVKQSTLQEYLDVAIYRDLIERHDIKNHIAIKHMIMSMLHSIGKPFTIHKLYNNMKSQGFKIGKTALYEYADFIEDAYLAFSVPLFNESYRITQTNPKKIYAIDPGLVRALTLNYERDTGKLFENIIFLELKRLGYQIYYYITSQGYEVDFLIQDRTGTKKLLQISWDVTDPKTLEREERALETAKAELGVEGQLITKDSFIRHGIRPLLKTS